MPKSLIFILILSVIVALKAPNFAYKAALATESHLESAAPENPSQKPPLQESVQSLMEEAQNKLQEGAGKALESAQEAAKSELRRQVERQIQTVENALTSAVKKVVDIIKEKTSKAVSKIKLYLIKLKDWIFKPRFVPPIQV